MTTLLASALLFDMDGTLVDSGVIVEKVWARFAGRFGIDVREILATSHGVRMSDTVEKWLPAGSDSASVIADLTEFEAVTVDGAAAVPGSVEFLAALPADRIALVTSAGRTLARSRMASVGLPMPAVLVTADDVAAGKPAPDCYLAAADALSVQPDQAIVFEDAEAGIAAGLAAGMRTVVVGDLRSDVTRGLPRIADYRGIRPSVSRDARGAVEIALELP